MDDLLLHAGYHQIHRPQLRPMAASKTASGPTTAVTSQSNAASAGEDDSWDWDGYGLGAKSSPAGVKSVDPIFGAFDHRHNGMKNTTGGNGVAFGGKGSPGFEGFDLMTSGVHDDVFENLGRVRKEKVDGRNVGGSDDLIPGFGVSEPKLSSSSHDVFENLGKTMSTNGGGGTDNAERVKGVSGFDDLIPGLGGGISHQSSKFPKIDPPTRTKSASLTGIAVEDPLANFESASAPFSSTSGLFTDFLNDSPVSINSQSPSVVEYSTSHSINYFDGFQDPTSFFLNEKNFTVAKGNTNHGNNASERKPPHQSSTMNFLDINFSFGGVEGESEDRGKTKSDRDLETRIRMARALEDKKARDMQIQREQDEKHRMAGNLDIDIKRWSAGKEGNLRALLSSLQSILGPESGWQPVSLTDLITAQAVKKVYKKATLYIHPDKVQQRGATLHQKFIAEKVFDIIKEAYKKFESEELF